MLPPSPKPRHSTPDAEDVRTKARQDAGMPSISHSDPSSSSPATQRSSSPTNSPFSPISRDSPLSAPSSARSHSHSQEPDGDQHPQEYPSHDNSAESDGGLSAASPIGPAVRFQEAFLTLLSLLPEHRYPVPPPSPALSSAATPSGSNHVATKEGEGYVSSRNHQPEEDDHQNGARGALANDWVGGDAHQGDLSGHW